MTDDLAVVVPFEILVGTIESLAVGRQISRSLPTGVLIGQISQCAFGHIGHFEGLPVNLECVAFFRVCVAPVHLCDLAISDHLLDVVIWKQIARVYLCHIRLQCRTD